MQRPTDKKKLLVYSHDAFGLGNIRRMLGITHHLLDSIPDLSVLLVSGSPMIHGFRLPERRFDYLKLPALGRTVRGDYSVKRLETRFDELVAARSQIIRATFAHFRPDIILVDKKPRGIANELLPGLELARAERRAPEVVLLLRDILDDPRTTARIWEKNHYFQSIERYYRSILVMGSPDVFDVCSEYRFPQPVADKVTYCGYTHRPRMAAETPGVDQQRSRVLVTAGGGEDGFELLQHYMTGLSLRRDRSFTSLVVTGPEMSREQRASIHDSAQGMADVRVVEFLPDLTEHMQAADLIVSMAGYNTVVEILSLNKRCLVVPRVRPVREQWIRAQRLERLGLLQCLDPETLTPARLMDAVSGQLANRNRPPHPSTRIDFDGLASVTRFLRSLLQCGQRSSSDETASRPLAKSRKRVAAC